MPKFHCLDPSQLERFLERRRSGRPFPAELNLAETLITILKKANEFVPSAAGSILLDDPLRAPGGKPGSDVLTFIACFGDSAEALLGAGLPADRGIAGEVYHTGVTYITGDAQQDRFFYPGIDEETRYKTESMVAIPIRIEQQICGVLELINRQKAGTFSEHDKNLLEIFADYISVSIENVLDGRRAQEIAKRDNLTGLYNDRYLHIALSQAITTCRETGQDLAVLFLDLDLFKRVNDTHGHLAGSQVLREVGFLLRRKIDRQGAIPTRYGGDEFVLVIPGLDLDDAVDLAEDIRGEILNHVFCPAPGEINPEPLSLRGQTCSIGIATLAQHITEDLETERIRSMLLRLADSAMYVAKETGRNRTAVAGAPVRRR